MHGRSIGSIGPILCAEQDTHCVLFASMTAPGMWGPGVMCLDFCAQHPSVLAVGCYNGSVMVFDLQDKVRGVGDCSSLKCTLDGALQSCSLCRPPLFPSMLLVYLSVHCSMSRRAARLGGLEQRRRRL
jgi:hypothetical protein